MSSANTPDDGAVVAWLRQVSPYFRRHRNKTFVVYVDGGAVEGEGFTNLARDLILLASVGVRLVVVFGARLQIEQRLATRGITPRVAGGLRVTDAATMAEVREVVGAMRLTVEAAFSLGSRGAGLTGMRTAIASGNYVTARPAGIIEGVDLGFTGLVRNVDRAAIEARLDAGEIVLLPPLGYSPTGELFNLRAKDMAAAVASGIAASKLVVVSEAPGLSGADGTLLRQVTARQAREFRDSQNFSDREAELLDCALRACQLGVERVHLVSRHVDGALLRELFTRDGVGTLISNAPFDQLRGAKADDVGGILELVAPLEAAGLLVKRSREKLEAEVDRFKVMIRENTIVACGALYRYGDSDAGEIACIAVHPDYRGGEFGDLLLDELEREARDLGLERVFALTTQATQWFGERGYRAGALEQLPVEKQRLYNFQRNSAVMLKSLR